MKILIHGATGPTRLQLVRLATRARHETTAIVRDRSNFTQSAESLTVITPDILDVQAMAFALSGQDCVLSALGGGKDLRSTIISRSMAVLIQAMEKARINRVVFLSSYGVGATGRQAKPFARQFLSTILKDIWWDKEKADDMLRASRLNYTIIYPTRLTNGGYSGHYRVGTQLSVGWWPRISRADVADFMLIVAERNLWNRQTVIISH